VGAGTVMMRALTRLPRANKETLSRNLVSGPLYPAALVIVSMEPSSTNLSYIDLGKFE
jgi:hypothetical protein